MFPRKYREDASTTRLIYSYEDLNDVHAHSIWQRTYVISNRLLSYNKLFDF